MKARILVVSGILIAVGQLHAANQTDPALALRKQNKKILKALEETSKEPSALRSFEPTKQLSDQELVATLLAKLFREPHFTPATTRVAIDKGIVTLTGTVESLRARDRATEIAEGLRGVRSVFNHLEIKPPEVADATLAQDVARALKSDGASKSEDIKATAEKGKITLAGNVASRAQSRLSEWVVGGVRGVRQIKNLLEYPAATPRPDGTILMNVKTLLQLNPWIDPTQIEVTAQDGALRFTGKVANLTQKRHLAETAWVAGVKQVNVDELNVDPMMKFNTTARAGRTARSSSDQKAAIEQALQSDYRIPASKIDVSVKGKVITLTGEAPTLLARQAAEEATLNATGASSVRNALKVTAPVAGDALGEARALLALDPMIDAGKLQVTASGKTLRLAGTVNSASERWYAGLDASRIAGIRKVDNRIELSRKLARKSDDEVRDITRSYLNAESVFDRTDKITVSAKNGIVTLTGVVDNRVEQTAATQAALDSGATRVVNKLRLRSEAAGRQPAAKK